MVEKDFGHRSTARLFLVIIRYQPVKQPYAEAGAPALIDVGLGRSHAGAGDVEMGPWGFIDETLEELWRFNVGTPLKGAPVTYAIGPKQYLAVQTSGRHLHPVKFDKLENSSYLFVFALN